MKGAFSQRATKFNLNQAEIRSGHSRRIERQQCVCVVYVRVHVGLHEGAMM